MIEAGFPAENISYYRGGMQNWHMLGLTVVAGRGGGLDRPRLSHADHQDHRRQGASDPGDLAKAQALAEEERPDDRPGRPA
jgi:hypothetical protein